MTQKNELKNLVDQYILYIDIKPETKLGYRRILNEFLKYVDTLSDLPVRQDIIQYREKLKERLKASSVQKHIVVIRNFYRWYSYEGYGLNVADGIKGMRIESNFKREALSQEASIKLLLKARSHSKRDVIGLRNYAIVALLLTTGLRTIEVERADVSDIDFINDFYVLYVMGKGRDDKDEYVKRSIVFTKAMIGMQANSPIRPSLFNKSVPFLNTLFVINEVNKEWSRRGNEAKGILRHEFGAFVLSMKDCDYIKATKEIITYREKFKYEINKEYIKKYLSENNILELKFNHIVSDYPDDVFRKFEMTGLIVDRGKFKYRYLSFSEYNLEKINIVLEKYQNYKFIEFKDQNDYYFHLENIEIPWEFDEKIRRKVVETKTKVLGLSFNEGTNLQQQEDIIDQIYYRKSLDYAIDNIELGKLKEEFKILTGRSSLKSIFDDLAEPLRLEYLLALLLGKLYGTKGLVSNIIYGEDGKPLHYAPAGKSDIVLYNEDGAYIFEPTMQRGRVQQLNSETSNIVRHVLDEKEKYGFDFRVLMIAPAIHRDVADFFLYQIERNDIKIIPSSIDRTTQLLLESSSIKKLNDNFDFIINDFRNMDLNQFVDKINSFRLV